MCKQAQSRLQLYYTTGSIGHTGSHSVQQSHTLSTCKARCCDCQATPTAVAMTNTDPTQQPMRPACHQPHGAMLPPRLTGCWPPCCCCCAAGGQLRSMKSAKRQVVGYCCCFSGDGRISPAAQAHAVRSRSLQGVRVSTRHV